jgi:RNA polymerase sigma-70 factor, ECF subfamily
MRAHISPTRIAVTIFARGFEPFLARGIPLGINVVVPACEQLPVAEARAGSSAAWNVLFRRYQLPLYVYVFELVHDEQASLDIVQETFINAARHVSRLREDARFGSWLFGIAHQKCLQRWRTLKREEALRDQINAHPLELDESPSDVLIREEQEAEFMTLLNQLPLPQRSVLLLHFLEDFSLEEIADITAAQLGTVKSRIHYAKKALRKLLEERENPA